MFSTQSQPSSPGPAYSDAGSTGGGGGRGGGGFGLLNSLKKALPHSPQRPHSPASSLGGGSDAGTPPSRSKLGLPSFSNGQRKREVIRKLEEDVGLLQMQLQQRESELAQLQQQAGAEQAVRVDAQQRLNMQYFKSHLLVDMLVVKLLDLEQQEAAAGGGAASPAKATAAAVVHVAAQQQAAAGGGGGGQMVMAESSFD